MTDEKIKLMVDRFLGWRLPENFNPDGGISFQKTFNENTPYPMKHEPTGTNLFDAIQAEEMIRYMLAEPAAPTAPVQTDLERIQASYTSGGQSYEPIAPVGQPETKQIAYSSSMPHVNCTGPCCRPDLWASGVKGVAAPAANALPETQKIPEDLQHGRHCAAWTDRNGYDVNSEDCTCGLRWRKEILNLQIALNSQIEITNNERAIKERAEVLLAAAQREIARLNKLINTPQTEDFIEAVKIEAAHQQERWGTEHDGGKTDADWFWLIGYLAGKILRPGITQEKRLHHIVTGASVFLNWHRYATGELTAMRPGIEPPDAHAELLGGKK